MTAITAILVDGYRELNSRKLFWITLVLSALIPLIFFAVDLTDTGLKLFVWEVDAPVNASIIDREDFFKNLFVDWGVGIWLTWIATILALVTTAGIIPDLVTGGAIDMVLSKPIRRSTLFLAKYASGLLFAAIQVTTFTLVAFVVLGIKVNAWMPGLFLAIPIVVVFFSYLYCICALLGLITRSTIAALMLTILCWFGFWLMNTTDTILLMVKEQQVAQVESLDASIERASTFRDRIADEVETSEDPEAAQRRLEALDQRIDDRQTDADRKRESARKITFASDIVVTVKTPLPKTAETILVLKRTLTDATIRPDDVSDAPEAAADPDDPFAAPDGSMNDMQAGIAVEEALKERSVAWVIGTSLLFELGILLLCLWIFARRDF